MSPTILTAAGRYFDFTAPEQCELGIDEIAHALSHICRFGGHTTEMYTVAQHSVLASMHVAPEHAYTALMHDIAEAFLGDVPSPLKRLLPDYRALEAQIEDAVFTRFGVTNPLPQAIKEIDLVLLATEQRDLMPPHDDDWASIKGVQPLHDRISCWSPWLARNNFLYQFWSLVPEDIGRSLAP